MKDKTYPICKLTEKVLGQLQAQNYMESSITNYRRFYMRLNKFLMQHSTDIYSKYMGEKYLQSLNVSRSTYSAYACAIRRLNDFLDGRPYRCHHDNPCDEAPYEYKEILDSYLEYCKRLGNKPATLSAKKQTVILFLKHAEKAGCSDVSLMDVSLVSKALLTFENKDNYARIRQFLKYLADIGAARIDLSGIVPRYKKPESVKLNKS